MTKEELTRKCRQLRRDIINMTADAASGHPGGSLSVVEMLACLYYNTMNVDPANPHWEDRDRFVLSKGHSAPALYAVLADKGFFPREELKNFRQLHSILQGHPDAKKCPGVDASTGSLGQGISIAVGMAIGAKLANLTVFVDNNGLQIDGTNDQVMSLGDLSAKFAAFGYQVIEVADGNDLEQVQAALDAGRQPGKPKLILCHTVKGKGVSFMENQVGWHGKAPNAQEREQALAELEG